LELAWQVSENVSAGYGRQSPVYLFPHVGDTSGGTLAYAVRIAGVRTRRIAISFSLFNILALVSRTSNSFQGPFLAKRIESRLLGAQLASSMLSDLRWLLVTATTATALGGRLRLSEVKKFKPMADFDWSWPKKIEHDVIGRALTLDFLAEARNLVLVGTNGLGKTMIAQNICNAAVLAGHSVLFRSAAALLEELHRQTDEGRHRKLRTYANVGLLCVDEVGYSAFDDKSADLLYEVINRRYERKSVILTTNRPFKEWNEVFPNAACIVTLLDRLLHHADVTKIEGDSYRVRESEQETAARRKKK
jgi:DNA replication protein DnaC